MAVEVVDRRQRQLVGGGHRLGRRQPHEQSGDEARPPRDGHELDVGQLRAGLMQRILDRRADKLEVVAAGDLRDDAAIAVVDPLGRDDVGTDLAGACDDCRTGVVAGGLESEDHPPRPTWEVVSRVRHMITASSPLSR